MNDIVKITTANELALLRASYSRDAIASSHDIKNMDIGTHVLENKRAYPYRGFVQVQPTVKCQPFLMFCNNDDLVALHFLWAGNVGWESTSLKIWSYLCTIADGTVLDIGAFSGVYSLTANSLGVSNIIAYEPGRMPSIRLVDNLNANSVSNVKVVTKAVSNHVGSARFELVRDLKTLSSAGHLTDVFTGVVTEPVDVTTIDDDLNTLSVGKVSLAKMDVEGAEFSALIGMKDTLSGYKPDMIIEIKPEYLSNITEYMSEFGYTGYLIDELNCQVLDIDQPPDGLNNYFFTASLDQLSRVREAITI